jgi:ABC-type transporter Mla MlaB component
MLAIVSPLAIPKPITKDGFHRPPNLLKHLQLSFRRSANGRPIAFDLLLGKNAMLRITLLDALEEVTLVLEGSLVGLWVTETETAWRSTQSALAGRPLVVDLKAVDRIDQAGVYLLSLLRLKGARLVASGAAMTELVRNIEKEWSRSENKRIH